MPNHTVVAIFPHTFRLHWLISYLMLSVPVQVVVCALLGAEVCSAFIRNGTGSGVSDLFLNGASISFVIGVLCLPIALRINSKHQVRIGPFGVEAMDDRGTRQLFGWNSMERVAVVRYWGWRSIRVQSTDGRTFWLPMYVSQPEEYGRVVEEYAGPCHPLSWAFSFAHPDL